jgi:hypothetical protein
MRCITFHPVFVAFHFCRGWSTNSARKSVEYVNSESKSFHSLLRFLNVKALHDDKNCSFFLSNDLVSQAECRQSIYSILWNPSTAKRFHDTKTNPPLKSCPTWYYGHGMSFFLRAPHNVFEQEKHQVLDMWETLKSQGIWIPSWSLATPQIQTPWWWPTRSEWVLFESKKRYRYALFLRMGVRSRDSIIC